MEVYIPVSPGELVDKITILEIKSRRIRNAFKLKSVKAELASLKITYKDIINSTDVSKPNLTALKKKLLNVNNKLWIIEDKIRIKESKGIYDSKFIHLARTVYITNDIRSELKSKINNLFGSHIKEVKQYAKYKTKNKLKAKY